jgi:hypothetical protein
MKRPRRHERSRLRAELEDLQARRQEVWRAFERTRDRRTHEELLAADEAVAAKLRKLRDLT